jgi:hypothetical protein
MLYIEDVFFYSVSCSTLLVYGLGLEKSFFESRPGSSFLVRIPAVALECLLSVSLLWFPASAVLVPSSFACLLPMATVAVCSIVSLLIQILVPSLSKTTAGERLFYFGTVFLSLSEAASFLDALCIAAATIVSFTLATGTLFTVRSRLSTSIVPADWKGAPLVLVSMGLLCIGMYSADVSWWLQEVFH